MNKKSLLQKANFAPPPSLLSAMPNAVKIGAGVGGGIGLLQGAGIFESDAEKKATNVGNRLGKVLTSTTVGAGLGAGAGFAANRYNTAIIAPQKEMQRREAVVAAHEAANPRGVRKAVKRVGREVEAVKNKVQEVVAPNLDQREARMAEDLKRQSTQPEPTPLIDQAINKGKQDIETTKKFFGGLLNKVRMKKETGAGTPPNTVNVNATTELSKMIRKSANFQDPATIQRLIQHGSTYIPQDNKGVVSLETTLRGKMQKRKLRETKVPASMDVKEINSMIESGKPVGKYFNKEIRKSANFLKRQQQAEFSIGDQINKVLVSAGKLITQPAAKTLRKAATKAGGGNLASITGNRIVAGLPFGIADKVNYGVAKTAVGTHDALNSVAKVLDTDKAAKYAAIGVGGTALAGGGLLAAKLAQKKQEDEARYAFSGKSANFFGNGFDLTRHDAIGKKLMQRHKTGDVQTQPDHEDPTGEGSIHLVKSPDGFNYIYRNGKLVEKIQTKASNYNIKIRKSASFGVIPTGMVNSTQKIARGAANRFGNLSPQINAANVGTAVGASLGALEGSGINETEEQRRSTGLVGRAGKVLGMTALGGTVGRGVGSVAGAGVNRYQANQRLQDRRKTNPDAFAKPVNKPRQIKIDD